MNKKKYATDYTLTELMLICAARQVRDKDVVFIGTGLPFLACMLAKKTHAPNLVPCSEQGQIDANPLLWRTPRSIGDLAMTAGSMLTTDPLGVMHRLTCGEFDLGFISGAQIDKYGNVNSTVIGDYKKDLVSKGYKDKEVDTWVAFIKERIEYWKGQEKARNIPTPYQY